MRIQLAKIKLIVLGILLSLTTVKAQIDTTGLNAKKWACGIDSSFWRVINLNPDLANARYVYDTTILSRSSSTVTPTTYTIPVVFHVISTTTNTTVLSYEQIKWQVAALNAAYENQMVAFRGGSVGSYTANAKIVFQLACNAEPLNGSGYYNSVAGQPCGWNNVTEPGVVRYATTNLNILNQGVLDPYSNGLMLAMTNPTGYFPKTDYLNIYCVPYIAAVGGGTTIGYGTFPWMIAPGVIDGITFRIDCIGNNSYPTHFPMLGQIDKGTVMAHEAGHYLGLYHTFESIVGLNPTTAGGSSGCYGTSGTYGTYSTSAYQDGDEVYDTPPTKVTADLGNLLVVNTCTESCAPYQSYTWTAGYTNADQYDQLENFMCYSDDDKLNTFTNLQCSRMWGALSTGGARANLTSSGNLSARGVGSCGVYTGIVSGVFNYNMAMGSSCTNVIINFQNPSNPTSGDFNSPSPPSTTYSWNFGDPGSGGLNTSTSLNPSHTYTNTSVTNYTVTCTATNGTVTNTYSTSISTNFKVHIVGQSSQQAGALGCSTCPANTTTATVCRGSEQTIFVWFDTGVSSALLTDGTNTYQVNNYMLLSQPEIIPYLITATATASYSISPASCSGVFNGSATFNVIDCCPSMVINGDFESTYTTTPTYGFNTNLFHTTVPVYSGGVQQFGDYDVNAVGSGYFATIPPFNTSIIKNCTGKVLQIDGFEGNNGTVNIPAGCPQNTSPLIWQETLTGLLPSTPYFYSFKIMENYKDGTICPLEFQTSVASNTVTLLPPQTLTPTIDYYNSLALALDWVVYTYTFTTPSTITTSSSFSVTIEQVNSFYGYYYDILMDNITFNQMTPGLQAIGNATICPTGTVQLNVQNNCADPANYNYIWSPASTLTNSVIANPVANPTTTTVYTLTAVPTNTLGGILPAYVTTVTVTVLPSILTPPTINIAGTTTLCPGGASSTTLTATGGTSYVWQPGSGTSNPIVFTPTVTTTYTVTGTDGVCKNTGTQTITVVVNTTPTTISVTPTSTILCSSNTATTLSASGATTYSWFPASNITGSSNSSTIIASPPSSTTFTVMGDYNGCTGTNTVSITVVPGPVLSYTASPSTSICVGQTVTLTVTGATGYNWYPGGATTNSIVITPSVTTSYGLTGTTGSCSAYNNITVVVNTYPTLTVTASPTLICVGQQANLSVGTASTYSWSPSTSINYPNNPNVIATPYSNTTYTVVGANGNCTATQTVAIAVQTNSCTGTQPPNYNLTGTITYTTTPILLAANSNLVITTGANITISNEELRIAPNAKITVSPSSTLTISGGWLHACASCSGSMWQGIIVQNGGVLVVNNSYIEDALQAIYTATNSAATPIPSYTVTNSILNNNNYGIYVDSHQGNLGGNTVYNTVFTSRALSSHTTASISTIKTNIGNATPLVPSTSNPIDLPLNGVAPIGFHIMDVNITYPINVGLSTQSYNIFDNLNVGVRAYRSSATIKNNHFQNLIGHNLGGNLSGLGVYGEAKTAPSGFRIVLNAVRSTLIIGNSTTTVDNTETNYFTNCYTGVFTDCMRQTFINNNIFTNETTATTFTTSTPVVGQCGVWHQLYGFRATSSDVENMQFCNNNCSNYATGFWMDFGHLNNTAAQAYFVSTNTITATTNTVTNPYCNIGAYVQQSNTSGAASGIGLTGFEFLGNTITNVNTNCIAIQSVNNSAATSGFLDVQQNTELSVKTNTYTAVQSPRIAAVNVTNSWFTRVSDNSNIRCTGITGTNTVTGQYVAGVYVNQSPHSYVNCNTVTNIGECFVWESTSPSYTLNSSSFQNNKMDYAHYGLVLRNSGVMGNQGSSGYKIGDQWTASAHFIAQTLSDGSNPGLYPTSKLYESSTACVYTPCTNTYVLGGTAYSSGTTLLGATGTNTLVCATEGGGHGGGGSRMAQLDSASTQDSLKALYISMLANNGTLPAYDYETRWALHHHIHSMMPNIGVATNGYDNAKAFAAVDTKMIEGNYNIAQALLNNITPSNVIEQNWQTVDNVLIGIQSSPLSASDATVLQNVAQQCPLTGGSIVWKARALLNVYYQTNVTYPDVCPTSTGILNRSANTETTGIENPYTSQSVSFYPNPNNGSMTFEYSIKEDAVLEISDLNGRLVGMYFLPAYNSHVEVKNEYLKNGVYMYRASTNGHVIKIGKIIVIE